jgi:serine protease Do
MHCPKCDHIQSSSTECEACGLIFARYEAVQKRKRQAAQEKDNALAKQSGSGLKISSVFVLLLVAVSATYFFTTRPTSDNSQSFAITPDNTPTEAVTLPTKAVTPKNTSNNKRTSRTHGLSIAGAGDATVSIETPFGSGSGFFIRDEWVVTNRHVIEINAEKIQQAKEKYEKARRFSDLEEQKLRGFRKKLPTIPNGPAKSQFIMIIEQKENELREALAKLNGIEEQLNRLEQPIHSSDIKIILADGSEYFANYLLVSDNYDLAILSLFASNHEILPRGHRSLAQGDKVYTIGSPVGLRQTVTSGIFSGYRKRKSDDHILLQTDAPINPGNSGGPLIDEHGFVHGINTSIIANTEGIGFAIPIDAVFTEFGSALQ